MKLSNAFSELNLVQDYVPIGNSNRPGKQITPSSITIHNTDNTSKGANAAAHAKYMKGADAQKRKVSWHFTVDDKYVYQSLPSNEASWHSSTKQGNETSISIEICMNAEMDEKAAYERAEWLTAIICYRNNFNPRSQVFQHNDWSGKNCPRVLRKTQKGWGNFLSRVQKKHSSLQPDDTIDIESMASGDEDSCDMCAPA